LIVSLFKPILLRPVLSLLSILAQVDKPLMDLLNLTGGHAVWSPIDKTLDGGELFKDENVFVLFIQVNCFKVGGQYLLI